MSTDWREKEREFLTSLKADTGRDLAEWMRVIAAQNLPHRNDIIDWLRQQGFPFARASWLERIHHNQGRPIYLDPAELVPSSVNTEAEAEALSEGGLQRLAAGGSRAVFLAAPLAAPTTERHAPAPTRAVPPPRIAAETPIPGTKAGKEDGAAHQSPAGARKEREDADATVDADTRQQPIDRRGERSGTPATEVQPSAPNSAGTTPALPDDESHAVTQPVAPSTQHTQSIMATPGLDDVLVKAKAYRPLAQHLVRMIEDAVPGLTLAPGPGHLLLTTADIPFGLIAISSKDIRLAVRLRPEVACAPFGPVKLPVTLTRAAQGMTHMAVLTDARQLDADLINLVQRAAKA